METIFIIYDTRKLFIIFICSLGTIKSNLKLNVIGTSKIFNRLHCLTETMCTSVVYLILYSLQMMIVELIWEY